MLTHRAGDDLEGGDQTGGLVGEEFVDNESSERASTDDGKGGRHFLLEAIVPKYIQLEPFYISLLPHANASRRKA